MDRWDWLIVVASVVLGQFALLGIELVRGQLERKQRRQDRRDDFQRQALLDLQAALFDLGTATAGIQELRVRHASDEDLTDEDLTTEDRALAPAFRKAMERTRLAAVSVNDDQVRQRVEDYRDAVEAVMNVGSYRSGTDPLPLARSMITSFDEVNGRIGKVLRSL